MGTTKDLEYWHLNVHENNLIIKSPHPNPLPKGEGVRYLSYFVHVPNSQKQLYYQFAKAIFRYPCSVLFQT